MRETAFIFLQEPGMGGGFSTIILFGGMFAIMYFLMIRPNMKKQKAEKKYQEDLKRGDRVVTTSGIHGKVVEIGPDTVTVETGAGKIKFERNAISGEMSNVRYGGAVENK